MEAPTTSAPVDLAEDARHLHNMLAPARDCLKGGIKVIDLPLPQGVPDMTRMAIHGKINFLLQTAGSAVTAISALREELRDLSTQRQEIGGKLLRINQKLYRAQQHRLHLEQEPHFVKDPEWQELTEIQIPALEAKAEEQSAINKTIGGNLDQQIAEKNTELSRYAGTLRMGIMGVRTDIAFLISSAEKPSPSGLLAVTHKSPIRKNGKKSGKELRRQRKEEMRHVGDLRVIQRERPQATSQDRPVNNIVEPVIGTFIFGETGPADLVSSMTVGTERAEINESPAAPSVTITSRSKDDGALPQSPETPPTPHSDTSLFGAFTVALPAQATGSLTIGFETTKSTIPQLEGRNEVI